MSTPNEGSDRIDYHETADITEVHAAVEREKPEPSAEVTPIPLWLTSVCALATIWAGVYFGIFNGGLSGSVYNEYESSPAVLFPLPKKAGAETGGAEVTLTLAQQGKTVFQDKCASCHQLSGQGLPGSVPPLAKSEWVLGSDRRMLAIVLKGAQGPITVHGTKNTYVGQTMAAWEGQLSPKKIAAVTSYVRQEWGNTAPEISEAKVVAAKKLFADQKVAWTEEQLLQIPDEPLPDEGGGKAAPAAGGSAPAAAGSPAASVPPGAAAPSAPTVAVGSPEQLELGKKHYMTICIACHQVTGMGLPGVFPPLTKSPYVNGPAERFAAIILKGNNPPFTLDGKTYVVPMIPQESVLNDEQIAAVMSFVRSTFENTPAAVSADVVAAARKKYLDHKTPWTQPELDAWK